MPKSRIISGPHRYDSVGRCIYCGEIGSKESRLGKEHILPSGIGGSLVLPKASCQDCEKLTGFCEDRVLHGMLNPIRAVLGAHGKRRPKDRETALPVTFEGRVVSEDIPLDEYPLTLTMPVLERPGFLVARDRADYDPGEINWCTWAAANAQERADSLMQERGVNTLEITHNLYPREFIKFLAKVAHSFALAEGVEFRPVLTDLIRSPRNASIIDAFHYIGSAKEPADGFPVYRWGEGTHRVALVTYANEAQSSFAFYSVLIQLFQLAQSPTYEVIVGSSGGTI